jgi:hypothetical protein
MDPIAFDAIADRSAHAGLKESLGECVGGYIVNLIELAWPACRKDQNQKVFGTTGRRARKCAHVQMFGFIRDFAHGRQGNFGQHLPSEIAG